jgi:carboxypeptidase C (cathepsin A)
MHTSYRSNTSPLVFIGGCLALWTSGPTFPATSNASAPTADSAAPGTRRFVSTHQGSFAGRKISYKVVSTDTLLKKDAGEPIGSIFSFSYLEDNAAASKRPVTFVFNGGPGSSSVWLHLGIGPRRLALKVPNPRVSPPYLLLDNPDSPLAVSDLVFVDPVGTGFSRFVGKGSAADFYGSNQDANSVAQFIERWLTENRRWQSPKFLLGESYGTVRASLLTAVLLGGSSGVALRGISLNGLILAGHDGGLVPLDSETRFQTNFTTQAASAWYHDRVDHAGRSFEQFIDAARNFAANVLMPALTGSATGKLDSAQMTRVSEGMSAFIGLPAGYIRANGLRISSVEFGHALLADEGMDIGLFDTRFTLPKKPSHDAVGLAPVAFGDPADDPVLSQVTPAFAGAFHSYLATELGVSIDGPYVLLADIENQWKNNGPPIDPGETLVNAMRRDRDLQVMFLGGWFDLIAGTIGAAEYGAAKRLPPGRSNVKAYLSGHMCYLGESAPSVGRDVSAFIAKASAME